MRVRYATSTLSDGPMGRSWALSVQARANRKKFLQQHFGVDLTRAVTAHLSHGTRVVAVSEKDAGSLIPECDGLITSAPGLPLIITTADCVPVCLWNAKDTVVAVLHAGWRGIERNILQSAVTQFFEFFHIPGSKLSAWFGPAIGVCHYEVREDVARRFRRAYPACVVEREGRLFLDLPGVLSVQAETLGIPREGIRKNDECTYLAPEKKGYFSARRGSAVKEGELMVTAVMIQR